MNERLAAAFALLPEYLGWHVLLSLSALLLGLAISLPLAVIGEFAQACVDALTLRWPGQHSVRFGHLGDGNLHLSTDARSLGGLPFAEAEAAVEELVYGLLATYGGSVSAEHGIGLHKKPYLGLSRSPAELTAMRQIKQALDPLGLMNPGKIF